MKVKIEDQKKILTRVAYDIDRANFKMNNIKYLGSNVGYPNKNLNPNQIHCAEIVCDDFTIMLYKYGRHSCLDYTGKDGKYDEKYMPMIDDEHFLTFPLRFMKKVLTNVYQIPKDVVKDIHYKHLELNRY